MISQEEELLAAVEQGILNVELFKEKNNEATNIFNYLNSSNKMKIYLGSGALGTVYSLNKDKVVKLNFPCANNNAKIHDLYCQDLLEYVNEKTPFTVIPSGEKLRYIIPNLFSESLISMYLSKSHPNFAKTLNCYVFEENNANFSSFSSNFQRLYDDRTKKQKETYGVEPMQIDNITKKKILKTSTGKINQKRELRNYEKIPGVMSIMEKYVSIFDKNRGQLIPMINPVNFVCLIYQVVSALDWAQAAHKFTHYDLHIDNVLIAPISDFSSLTIIKYKENFSILSSQCPFIVKIADFGLSRLETDSSIITATITDFPDGNFGEFNYSYDFMSFLGSIMLDYRFSNKFYPLFDRFSDLYFLLVKLMVWYLNEDINFSSVSKNNKESLRNILKYLAEKYYSKGKNGEIMYRPKMMDRNLVKYYNTRTMTETAIFLEEFMIQNYLGIKNFRQMNNKKSNVINIPKSLPITISKIIPFGDIIPIPRIPPIEQVSSSFVEMQVADNIMARTYRIIYSSPPNDYNFTLDQKQIKSCPIQEHYMTAIFISNSGLKKGYRYTSECCMIDPINFIRNRNFTGFVVNGGFFNIGKDYLPVGPYKDRNVLAREGSLHIPQKYSDVYGFVMMKDDNLIITRNEKLISQYDYGFSTGPFLIENGEIVFDPDDERFACTTSNNITNKFTDIKVLSETEKEIKVSGYVEYEYNPDNDNCIGITNNTEKTFPRCDKIEPGELSHANNPNPRTIVFVLQNATVVFLTVEGRGSRGIGIDLYTLAQSIKQTFPTVVTAINLDGGRSSNIAWRSESDYSTVYISNPDHMYQYPVGNIIVFGKKF